jgi:hypothetical protein
MVVLYHEGMTVRGFVLAGLFAVPFFAFCGWSQSAPSGSSSSVQHPRRSAPSEGPGIDAGSISQGVYRNKSFGFACKVPAGWVLRTDELNARDDGDSESGTAKSATPSGSERVLLAAFARPPLARGEDVNSSILIAAESASAYPGLKEAAQYFGPVTEVAKAQGFTVEEEPYEFAVGAKNLVRGDFEKNVGSRAMRQSTLVILARGYAVSFTFIGGTEDEVEELIAGLSFAGAAKPQAH